MMEGIPSFLVLVTGHAAAGKTTVAEQLAGHLDAIWISRDAIHAKVYSGWKPQHPALTTDHYDPQVDGNTFFEGGVVWDIFLSMLTAVAPHHPVVADTPFNHPWNRDMFQQEAAGWRFPVVEVALDGDPATLLSRARRRSQQPDVHQIKARFSVRPERYENAYRPVLAEDQVIHVDTTNLDDVNPAHFSHVIRNRLAESAGPAAGQHRPPESDHAGS